MEAFKYTFSKPGACRAAVNYYRMLPKSRRKALHHSIGKIEKPVLLIWVSVPVDIPIKPPSTVCNSWSETCRELLLLTVYT